MVSTAPMFLDDELQEREEELGSEFEQQKQNLKQQHVDADSEFTRLGKKTLIAAEKGRLLELASLIGRNPKLVNFKDDDNYTPLHRASYGGHRDCAKYLIKHGADLEAKTNDEWTPLHCAVRWNNLEVAEHLVQAGANINAESEGSNSPLHIVASNGPYSLTCDIIQLLLFHPNCDHTIRNNSGDTAFDIAKRSGPFYKFWKGVVTLSDDCIFNADGE